MGFPEDFDELLSKSYASVVFYDLYGRISEGFYQLCPPDHHHSNDFSYVGCLTHSYYLI